MTISDEEYYYEVQGDECLSSIAFRHGLKWKKVWNASQNTALRELRKDPNKLAIGDQVWIPSRGQNKESKPTDSSNKFKLKKPGTVLKLKLKIGGNPIRDETCVLVVKDWIWSDERRKSGKTDNDGNVEIEGSKEIKLAPNIHSAKLEVGSSGPPLIFHLKLCSLEPHDTLLGTAQRLENLGFVAGRGLADELTKKDQASHGLKRLRYALRRFERDCKFPVTGDISQKIQERLKTEHGS